MIAGILLAQAFTFAVLSALVASNKNRDPAGWGILGFLFGLVGFIAAVAVGKVEEGTRSPRGGSQPSDAQEFNPEGEEKKCPDCAEYIKLEARVCKHCGHEFSDEKVEQQVAQAREEYQMERGEEGEDEMETASLKESMAVLGIIAIIVGGIALLVLFTGGG